jgi:protein CpxP
MTDQNAPVQTTTRPKRTKLALAATIIGVTLVAGTAIAGPRGFFSKDEAKAKRAIAHVVDDLMDDLNGTDAQRKAVHDVATRLYTDLAPLKAEKEAAKGELRALFLNDTPDATAVHATVDERTASMVKAAHRATDAALELHAILNKAQREKLVEKIDERSGRGHRRGWY